MNNEDNHVGWGGGQVAAVRDGWGDAGKEFVVLGPAVFLKQWWVPIIDPDDEDPTFYKAAALRRKP